MKTTSAYTLIEILVSLTIIAVLFTVGYINFRDYSRRQALANSGKILQGDLVLTQQQALSGQKPDDPNCNDPNILNGYFFNVVSNTEYQIYASCSGGAVLTLSKDVTLPGGITISTPTPNPILFKILGSGTNIVSGGNVAITLSQTSSTNTFTVTIGSGGEIQ